VVTERSIAAGTHGRYLVEAPSTPTAPAPCPVLVGFHGYAESAEIELDRLRSISGAGGWLLVSVQGLHRFYRSRSEDVVAGWMTRQDRDLAIADNLAYTAAVLHAVSREWNTDGRVVFSGFSQGVAMAFRAAAASARAAGTVVAVVALGGDVPPELDSVALARIPAVLIGRGTRDGWYGTETFDSDVQRLSAAGVHVEAAALDAGHEWIDAFSRAAGAFLSRRE
jgi:predicted esterase